MIKRSFLKQPSAVNALSRCLRASCFLAFASLTLISCGHQQKKIGIIEAKCGTCHDTDRIYQSHRPKAEWDMLVSGMKVRGLVMSPAEEKQVMYILYNKFGNGK